MRRPVRLAHPGQSGTHRGERRLVVVGDDRGQVAGDDPVPVGASRLLASGADVLGRHRLGEDDAVRKRAGQGERARTTHAEHDGRHDGGDGRGVQAPLLVVAATLDVDDRKPAQQIANRRRRGGEPVQRAGGPGPDPAQPVRHPVPDPRDDPPRTELGERRELHGGEDLVARPGGKDPDTDRDPLGGAEHRRSLSDPTAEAEVLHDPQLREPGLLRAPGEREHELGGKVTGQEDAEGRGGPHQPSMAADDGRAALVRAARVR